MSLRDPRTVVIAEDSAAIRSILAFLLRGRGIEVVECSDGDDALERIKLLHPDLAILDVMMPGLSGFDVCRAVKDTDATKSIPVLILTSVTQGTGKSDEHWKTLSGADDFLTKPFKAVDLLSRVDKLLEPSVQH